MSLVIGSGEGGVVQLTCAIILQPLCQAGTSSPSNPPPTEGLLSSRYLHSLDLFRMHRNIRETQIILHPIRIILQVGSFCQLDLYVHLDQHPPLDTKQIFRTRVYPAFPCHVLSTIDTVPITFQPQSDYNFSLLSYFKGRATKGCWHVDAGYGIQGDERICTST